MDYEKKYKEALERAKLSRLQLLDIGEEATEIEYIFPELAGSEDEKVRKALIEMVRDRTGDELWEDYNVHKEEVLAWLEKQGEAYTKRDVDDAWLKGMVCAKTELDKQREQDSSWSKEDDVRLQACIDTLQAESLMGKVDTVMTNWLKSLKQRIGG